jgi:hypothetical protein
MKREQCSTRRSDAADRYPHLWDWVQEKGWIEIGRDGHSSSFIRALDVGGLVWEGKGKYKSLEDALRDLDQGIAAWLQGNNEDEERA